MPETLISVATEYPLCERTLAWNDPLLPIRNSQAGLGQTLSIILEVQR